VCGTARRSSPTGPFAETKEQIGGLMEIEAEDLDAAIAVGSAGSGRLPWRPSS
jgi:hypothetical protein